MNYELLASQLIRGVRGKRSQVALSRRLKYKTNAVHKWEAGRDFPTTARFFQVLVRIGRDPREVLRVFHLKAPEWLDGLDLTTSEGVAAWLRELRGNTPILTLAERSGFTRFAISRWLKGQTEPRLDQALALIEVCTLRVLDFVAALTDPLQLPVARRAYQHLQAMRDAAHKAPWTQAILRALELPAYAALPSHRDDWIAESLGITAAEVADAIDLLRSTGQVERSGKRWVVVQALSVDTRRDQAATRQQRSFWTRVALDRLVVGAPGTFSYNVFGISNEDLAKLRELHAHYFAEMRAIIAASKSTERVVVVTTQLFALDGKELLKKESADRRFGMRAAGPD